MAARGGRRRRQGRRAPAAVARGGVGAGEATVDLALPGCCWRRRCHLLFTPDNLCFASKEWLVLLKSVLGHGYTMHYF